MTRLAWVGAAVGGLTVAAVACEGDPVGVADPWSAGAPTGASGSGTDAAGFTSTAGASGSVNTAGDAGQAPFGGGGETGGGLTVGGASSGGRLDGGASATGGASSGGRLDGGAPATGGASSGGRLDGGAPATGGASSGGRLDGGASATGGASSGGTPTGGTSTGGTSTAPTGGAGGAGCVEGTPRGTCSNPEYCNDGKWSYDPRCDACGIVVCTAGSGLSCCNGWGVYALDYPSYADSPELISDFEVLDDRVTATYAFTDGGQDGALALNLPREFTIREFIDTVFIDFTYDYVSDNAYPEISLGRDDGDFGCSFGLDMYGDLDWTNVHQAWGEGVTNPYDCPTDATFDQIDIRLRSRLATTETITIYGVSFEHG